MRKKSKLKPATSLLGLAGITMASMVAGCDQTSEDPGLVSKTDDGACVIARMAAASPANADATPCSPCAGAEGCNPCNPCGACNPCNPCAAKACNPCAAACNPCAAAACNPCAAACNPCAAACNPCAAAACNPCAAACNPCAAACNPCAAACNPCGAAGNWDAPEPTDAELAAVYDCMKASMQDSYAMAAEPGAADYQGWRRYNTAPYTSGTHGGRYVNNYSNGVGAREYAKFEDIDTMPEGSILAKDSFLIDGSGKVKPGPLFLMQKMETGFNEGFGDWKYSMIMPDGTTWGVTNGKNKNGIKFCQNCHIAAEDFDHMFFVPDEYRAE